MAQKVVQNVVTIRHEQCVKQEARNPRLTYRGIKRALKLAHHLRQYARNHKSITIMTSPSTRCAWTARIIQGVFICTGAGFPLFLKDELLKFSKDDGDTIDEEQYEQIIALIQEARGLVLVVTHHQLSDGSLLLRLAEKLGLPQNGQTNLGKVQQGGVYGLNRVTGKISLLYGTKVQQGGGS